MADFDIRSDSGEEFSIGGQITKPLLPGDPTPWPNYPSSAAGFSVVFTAKRNKADAAPVVQRTGTLADGGAWLVLIQDTDTTGFTRTEELAFDVALVEPSGVKTVVCKGTWSVDKSVGL